MSSVNWQENLVDLDADLRRVASDWLRKIANNSAETNVHFDDNFRQIFHAISYDSLNAAYWLIKREIQLKQFYPPHGAAGLDVPFRSLSVIPAPNSINSTPAAATGIISNPPIESNKRLSTEPNTQTESNQSKKLCTGGTVAVVSNNGKINLPNIFRNNAPGQGSSSSVINETATSASSERPKVQSPFSGTAELPQTSYRSGSWQPLEQRNNKISSPLNQPKPAEKP